MLSIKLHEATREFKISNKLAMFFLEKLNIPVKSHSSVITMEQLEQLREFSGNKEKFSHIVQEFNRIEKEIKKSKEKDAGRKEEPPAVEPQKKETPGVDKIQKEEPRLPVREERAEPRHEVKAEPDRKPSRPVEVPGETVRRPEHKPENRPEHKPEHRHEHRPEHRPENRREHRPEHRHEHRPEPPSRPAPPQTAPAPPPSEPAASSAPPPPTQAPAPPSPAPTPVPPSPAPPPHKPPHPAPPPQKPPATPPLKKELKVEKETEKERGKEKIDKHKPRKVVAVDDLAEHEDVETYVHPQQIRRPQPKKKEKPKIKDRARIREERERAEAERKARQLELERKKAKTLQLPEMIQTSDFINIKELADKLNVKLKDIEEKMRSSKKEYLPNQVLDAEDIHDICAAFGVEVDIITYEDDIHNHHIAGSGAQQSSRAPVVTVMGHVDHGKTTLLDTLRNARVADKEAGGITQKIGAYKLSYNDNDIVFIDTPGHEAFTNIRARGAKVTDIVILVVAANDGVQPQTIEAINHARAADVPLIVAINKIDLDGANSSKIKEQLTRHEIVVEDWGGDVVCVEISAKQNKNLDSLLEMLSLVSEMLELKAYKNIPARGTIIESRLDSKLGPMGTVLIQHGVLKRGDFFICGNSVGKVKAIFDDKNNVLQQAEVPLPVEIMGFDQVPEAGELFQVTDDVEKAKKVVELRKQRDKENRKDEAFSDKKLSLQNLFQKLEENKIKVISIIMKTDNFSSGEVLEQILNKQSQEQLKINIIQKGIGNITESDILLASTSGAMIIGFNVKTPQNVMIMAKRERVEIRLYNVIYHLIEDIEKAIKGEITPEYVENLIGKVEVLQTFKISKVGLIAGCLVKEGKVNKKSKIKLFRKDYLVFEGEIENLKRVKNDVSEVPAGTECGLRIKNFNAIEVGDILEIYEVKLKE